MLPESRSLFVYILASRSGVLYTGCTRDLTAVSTSINMAFALDSRGITA